MSAITVNTVVKDGGNNLAISAVVVIVLEQLNLQAFNKYQEQVHSNVMQKLAQLKMYM